MKYTDINRLRKTAEAGPNALDVIKNYRRDGDKDPAFAPIARKALDTMSSGEKMWLGIGAVGGGIGGYLLSKLLHRKASLGTRLLYTLGGAAAGGATPYLIFKNMASDKVKGATLGEEMRLAEAYQNASPETRATIDAVVKKLKADKKQAVLDIFDDITSAATNSDGMARKLMRGGTAIAGSVATDKVVGRRLFSNPGQYTLDELSRTISHLNEEIRASRMTVADAQNILRRDFGYQAQVFDFGPANGGTRIVDPKTEIFSARNIPGRPEPITHVEARSTTSPADPSTVSARTRASLRHPWRTLRGNPVASRFARGIVDLGGGLAASYLSDKAWDFINDKVEDRAGMNRELTDEDILRIREEYDAAKASGVGK